MSFIASRLEYYLASFHRAVVLLPSLIFVEVDCAIVKLRCTMARKFEKLQVYNGSDDSFDTPSTAAQ
jgi:hypothetical protein